MQHSITALNLRLLLPVFGLLLLLFGNQVALAQDENTPPTDEDFFVFDENETPDFTNADPLEPLNRVIFDFNDKIYRGALKPVFQSLRLLPPGMLSSFRNFFFNIGAPVSAASALLQADPVNAASELARFVINSTVGFAGFFDVASELGIKQDREDLGQTLGRYGIGNGLYVVVPFYGGTTLRDILGSSATSALDPVYNNLATGEIMAINFTYTEIELAIDQDSYEAFYSSSLDPYLFFKNAYLQNRAGAVAQ
jgi:phospholipid-binding lipoprotein MlaA